MDEEQVVNAENPTPSEQQAVTPETAETVPQPVQEESQPQGDVEAVDGTGVPWKNRALEWQRKTNELTEELPKIIKKTLEEHQRPQQEYTIDQIPLIRQWAKEDPSREGQAELLIEQIRQREWEKKLDERDKKLHEQTKAEQIKKEAELYVVSNPRYQEAFVTDALGRKQWNPKHPFTQLVGEYLNNSDVKSRPDALAIATKLAYADYVEMKQPIIQKKVDTLQRTVKKAQMATMVEGGQSQEAAPAKTEFQQSQERLRQTGTLKDAQQAVRAYFKNVGYIKE